MKKETKQFTVHIVALLLMLVLPMSGVYFSCKLNSEYLEFPPKARYVEHAQFSWPVLVGLAIFIAAICLPFVFKVAQTFLSVIVNKSQKGTSTVLNQPTSDSHWPVWGTLGIIIGIIAWVLAWNRFAWFSSLQVFTFTPLWVAYIVVINAFTWKRTGQCMMINKPKFFGILFILSAFFWWFFEYLNRFVQNWYYEGIGDLSPFSYFIYATLPFSTVLPAVLGTYDLLESCPKLYSGLNNFIKIKINQKIASWILLIICTIGLVLIGIFPNYLFPLLWVSPLGIITAIMTLQGRKTIFANLANGDWQRIYLLALSALICGFFWEMWNYHSLAKWVYEVPFVNRFQIFEMPILGYSGYLPFGLECAIIVEMFNLEKTQETQKTRG